MEHSPLRILLVEDDEASSYLLKLACERHTLALELDQAYSYEEAVELFDGSRHNLVLSDFNLLDYDAIDVFKHVHSINPNTVVIALSASFGPEQLQRVSEMGMSACLEKELAEPFLEKILASYQTLAK